MSPIGHKSAAHRWGVLVALTLLLWSSMALASDFVIMRPGDVGEDGPFFEELLQQTRKQCGCETCTCPDLEKRDLYIGRYDLNGDGVEELFVVFSRSCGTAGCENPIYQKRHGTWVEIAGLDGGGWISPEESGATQCQFIEVPGERRHGWLTLIGLEHGLRWVRDRRTGKIDYTWFCLTQECRHETGSPLETRWTAWATSPEIVAARVGPLCAKPGGLPAGGYEAYNPSSRALGRYQMRPDALAEIGITRKGSPHLWNPDNSYGVRTPAEFLANPSAQERALEDYLGKIEEQLVSKHAADQIGQHIQGVSDRTIEVTLSGLVAAGHREGAETVRQYLDFVQRQGWRNSHDALRGLPKRLREKFLHIETRLREFEHVPYRQ